MLAIVIGSALAGVSLASACAGTPACELNSDCVEGYCDAGECQVDCVDAEIDCPDGYICNRIGQCQAPTEAGGGPGSGAAGPGGAGGGAGGVGGTAAGGSAAGGSAAGGSAAGGSGGGPTAKGELELCAAGSCEAGLACEEMVVGGARRCARSCTSHAQCPVGTRCVDKGAGGRCFGNDTGRPCTAAAQCNFACITGPGYCTNTCASGGDCPNGYACMEVSGVDACVKLEAACDGSTNADCVVQAACDTTDPNLIIWGCTAACTTAADCPQRALPLSPWTCDGLCRRPPDVYGPLPGGSSPTEWHCDASLNGVNLCGDAQHIDFVAFTIPQPPSPIDCGSQLTTTGAANDSCVNSCRYQGDCPHGFGCVAVGQVSGQRIGLCLPTGAVEIGGACTNNTQCAFGYCVNGTCSRDCTVDGICTGGTSCVDGGSVPVEGMQFRRCE